MSSATTAGRLFRRQLADAARELRPAEPMRLLAKRMAPLVRQKESLGKLQVLLRLTFDAAEPARGVLVFEWPAAAHGHSIVSVLERWSGRCADGPCRDGGLTLSCRSVKDEGDRIAGTHLKVEFEVAALPESVDELLGLAARVGLGEVLGGPIEQAPEAERAAPTPAKPRTESKASRAADPVEQAAIDGITHNALFDPSTHPKVSVNEEVTASSGVTFRLTMKRVGGQRRRVWIRVASTPEAVSRAG